MTRDYGNLTNGRKTQEPQEKVTAPTPCFEHAGVTCKNRLLKKTVSLLLGFRKRSGRKTKVKLEVKQPHDHTWRKRGGPKPQFLRAGFGGKGPDLSEKKKKGVWGIKGIYLKKGEESV